MPQATRPASPAGHTSAHGSSLSVITHLAVCHDGATGYAWRMPSTGTIILSPEAPRVFNAVAALINYYGSAAAVEASGTASRLFGEWIITESGEHVAANLGPAYVAECLVEDAQAAYDALPAGAPLPVFYAALDLLTEARRWARHLA
jgi:hypothetical protein